MARKDLQVYSFTLALLLMFSMRSSRRKLKVTSLGRLISRIACPNCEPANREKSVRLGKKLND
jgi:hypothetical protein